MKKTSGGPDGTPGEENPAAHFRVSAAKNDTMKTYMNEIGQISLVSREQEVFLAAAIHGMAHGAYDEARRTLISANLGLVVKIAQDFKELGLPLPDLISEGNIGLMRAVEKFVPAQVAKFSSYAAWRLKQAMRRALANQSRIIRIPVQSAGKIARIKHCRVQPAAKLGREPADAEIAENLAFSERTVSGLRLAESRTFPLHDPIQQGEEGEFQDIIPDQGARTPDRYSGRRGIPAPTGRSAGRIERPGTADSENALRAGRHAAQNAGEGRLDQRTRPPNPEPTIDQTARTPRGRSRLHQRITAIGQSL